MKVKAKIKMKIHENSSIRYQVIDLINYINDRAWFVSAVVSTLLALAIVWSFGFVTILLSR